MRGHRFQKIDRDPPAKETSSSSGKSSTQPSFRYQLLQPNDSFSVSGVHLKVRWIRTVKSKGRGKQTLHSVCRA
ncbi:hypothetical protein AU385_04665 [Bacillus halotolerans]|nr:hypothetical protein AU385_04665 [Bacillus halotolerans]OEC79017.1 hypothetical protein BCV60_11355 [Bacillus halotolerans]